MGQIAEDLDNGRACEICGCYFENPDAEPDGDDMIFEHGYPVVCYSCYNSLSPEEKKLAQKAKVNTL